MVYIKNRLSITIITLGNYEILKNCLNSIYKNNSRIDLEIIVIANNVQPRILIAIRNDFPQVKLIQTDGFKGFAENQNIGLRNVTGEFVCVLNDDVYFVDDSLTKMRDLMIKNEYISFISPVILNSDNSNQFVPMKKEVGFLLFVKNLIASHLFKVNNFTSELNQRKESTLIKIYNLSGACFITRTLNFRSFDFFDEDYFFTPEDIDLAIQATKAGKEIYYSLDSKVIHLHKSTSKNISFVTATSGWLGIFLLVRKHFGTSYEIIIRSLTFIISIPKLFIYTLFFDKNKQLLYYYLLLFSLKNILPKEFVKIVLGKRFE